MNEGRRTYIAIDLKSYFASVECVERGLNPLTTNLVVADAGRTEKTICLAVSPSLKAYGIPGRARLFEVVQRVKMVNNERRLRSPGRRLVGKSVSDDELKAHPDMEVDYITAMPRMAHYIDYSTRIYAVYLKYIAPEDMHVYSIDEVFMDVTSYLKMYGMTAHELAMTIIRDVLATTGITATAGIGSNLYLCKVALDSVAKHIPADEDGVRIAELDEMSYRRLLWSHRPLTSFWRVGRGTARKLEMYGIYTMGDIARLSVRNEELFYHLFGVNAELLIDHAWGWEPCTMGMIKAYKPESNSLSSGQVLQCPYTFDKARIVVMEMAEAMAMELLDKRMVCAQFVLTVGYDAGNAIGEDSREVVTDYYGRRIPKPAHGTVNVESPTSSSGGIIEAVVSLFDRIVSRDLLVRRLNLAANRVEKEEDVVNRIKGETMQLDLFADYEAEMEEREKIACKSAKERRMQEAMLHIKKTYGKNAILKGFDFADGATAVDRNSRIGGHKA